jgi:hypothetical protein
MRRFLFGLAAALLISSAALADKPAITGVIGAQIEAFQEDDFARAFTHASPNIQEIFGTSERFGTMVREGYPMVWRPAQVRYLELREIAGSLWQRVMVTDQSGRVHLLDYQMVETGECWKINGVQLLDAKAGSA